MSGRVTENQIRVAVHMLDALYPHTALAALRVEWQKATTPAARHEIEQQARAVKLVEEICR